MNVTKNGRRGTGSVKTTKSVKKDASVAVNVRRNVSTSFFYESPVLCEVDLHSKTTPPVPYTLNRRGRETNVYHFDSV